MTLAVCRQIALPSELPSRHVCAATAFDAFKDGLQT